MAPATTLAGTIPRYDITSAILKLQQQSPKVVVDLTSLPPNYLQGAVSQLMGRGLAGINFYFDDLNLSVKDTQLLELLLGKVTQHPECRMNLPQSATAIYYLYTQLISGRTPDPNDNMIHISFADLRAAAANSNLQSSLYAKIKDGKPDKLFAKNTMPPAVAPGIGHNPAATGIAQTVSAEASQTSPTATVVHDPAALLGVMASYIEDKDPAKVIQDAGRVLFNG